MSNTEVGSFVVNLEAKIQGYQSELEKMKKAIERVGKDSDIGKELTKQLASLTKEVDAFSKHMTQRIGSETQLTKLVDKIREIDTAFITLGSDMQKVKVGDLNFDALSSSTQQLIRDLQAAQQALEKTFSQGFKEAASGSKELQDAFKLLNIDPDTMSPEKIGKKLTNGLQDAQKDLEETGKRIDALIEKQGQLQTALAEKKNSTFGDKNVSDSSIFDTYFDMSKARDISDSIGNWLNDVKDKFRTAAAGMTSESKKKTANELIEQLIGINDPKKLQEQFTEIIKVIGEGSKNLDVVRNSFHVDNRTGAAMADAIVKSFNFNSFNSDAIKQQLEDFLSINKIELDANVKEKLINSITIVTEKDIKKAEEAIKKFFEAQRSETNKQILKTERELGKNQEQLNAERLKQTTDSQRVDTLSGGLQAYLDKINQLETTISQQQEEIRNLRAQLEAEMRKSDSGNVKAGESGSKFGNEQLKEGAKAVQQYTKQLEAAKEAEKMVGKIEGIAQRWFSVYAAVRMVTNAINSMKSTLAELDKTITEIAIVTNMSQGDLWGQMGTYTQLAREYAASIQGVYQVSQLYYQQGLQTADVMALTESTLKMARISGLDYAEATDYMTNAVRSFKMEMEDAETVVDVYSAIAAKSATNVKELAIAMSKTASSAESVGSSFQNTTAMMAVMIEATRESSQNIGSAMKSIISRYGELKENPAKLVDSEGEELSLNKVDKALQSVGITLHNAQGQFRDFDEVIEELAKSWDTIDINTQRYIATVMAGNRQQSRFLALVSNYDRYKELSEEAANAENAAQLQFLKTLDSIEAKTQQLQTSLQSLYTSSGLENFYKGILDISNEIIKAFTDMPTVFNLPIPAIINFGSTFYTLASIVKTVIQLVINEIAISATKIKNVGEKEVSDNIQQNNEKLQNWKSYLQERLNLYRLHVKDIIAAQKGENVDNLEDYQIKAIKEKGIGQNVKEVQFGKFGLQIGSLIASAIGTTLKSDKESIFSQVAGGFLSAGSQAMQFGLMSGGNPIAIAAGAALGIVQNADSIFQTFEKRIANLTEIASEANNKVLIEQAEAKSIQASIQKLKELEKTRYDSIEAEKAYLEASDTLAKQYPELINAYDETGKALINTESASELLISSLKEVVSATEAASTANFKLALERYNQKQQEIDQKKNQPTETTGFGSKGWQLLKALEESNPEEIGYEATSLLWDYWNSGDIEGYLIRYVEDAGEELSTGFSDYINRYLNNTLEDFSQQKPKIDVSKLNTVESILYNHIESLINEYASLPSLENANKKNLQMSAKANLMSDIDAYLSLIEATEKDNPFEGMSEYAALIKNYAIKDVNIEELDTLEDWEKARSEAQEATQTYYNTLKDWYKDIDKETYKGVMAFKGKVSSKKLIDMLREAFPGIEDNIIEAFEETFQDNFTNINYLQAAAKFDNSGIRSILYTISGQTLKQLSDAERQTIINYGKQIEQLIADGKLTQQQGENNLRAYFNIWEKLREAGISEEQREAAEELLRTWDGTREGLEGIITSLDGVENANGVINAVKTLIPLISQNLNTTFQTLATSISSKTKDFKDISQLSKGVDIDKAIKYAEELGLSFSDLELDYSTGLFKLGDLSKGYEHYFEKIGKQIEEADKQLNLYTDSVNNDFIKKLISFGEEGRDISEPGKNKQAERIYTYLGNKGLKKGEVDSVISEFENSGYKDFDQWLIDHYQSLSETLQAALSDAKARAELNTGNITNFVMQAIGVSQEVAQIIADSLISEGGFNREAIVTALGKNANEVNLDLLEKYGISIADALGETAKGVYDKAIESITKGRAVQVPVIEANQAVLQALGATIKDGIATIDWSSTNVSTYRDQANKIIADTTLTNEEKDSLLASLENAVRSDDVSDIFDSIISNYQGFGLEAANKLSRITGKTIEQLNLTFNEIVGEYSIGLQQLRQLVAEAGGMTLKEKNAALAKIDKEIRETSVQSTFSDLVKNADNLSEDIIRAWADSIGASYEAYANLWRQKDGTYKIDLAGLAYNKKILEEQGNQFATGVLDSIIDEYLNQLSNISDAQTSGYTNLSDMRAVADKFANGDLGIFKWNKELRTYILTTEGIMQQAVAAAEQIKSLDKDSQEYKKAWKLIQADGQALADNINFLGLIGAVGSDQFVFEAQKFIGAVQDYNAYLTGIGEEVGLSAAKLISLAQKGGLSAVKAAQEIAERAGKKLEGSDIETIYRSGANKINTALEQVNLSIGSVIDSTTVELLGIQGQVTDLGSGKYVINSSIDLVEAHQQLLRAMYNDNTYTLSELNALQAKVMAGNEQADLLESISNISELTYDTLGQIAEQAGYSLFNFYEQLSKNGAIKNLGGGKIHITDFDYFADLIGLTDRSSEEYIQVLSKYNDEVINYNRSRADAVVSELKAISEAKAGDQINVSNIMGQFGENTRKLLETTFSAATGAELKNGLLNINDANIVAILGYFKDISKDFEGISERDKAEIEDAFEALLNNITDAIKQGLEGKLSNVGKVDLQDSLKSAYGVELKDSDFAKTADGLKMTEQAAIRVYNTMKNIDALQASLVLTELNNSLKESNENYESMGDIMNHIAQLEKQINDPNVSPARKQMYEQELEVAKEIAQVRATTDDSDSFAFMSNKLPGAMENPLTYAENWGKAIKALNDGAKSGHIDARDWYNIVNEMNNIAGIGQDIEMYGVTLNGSLEAASELIQKGFNALESVDGGDMQVNLSGLGVSFEQGAMDMKGSVTEGIHAMARSQIEMLDGLIAVLETVVAMQEAFEGLKASEDGKLDFGELFEEKIDIEGIESWVATDDFQKAASKLLQQSEKSKDLKKALSQIRIDGQELGKLYDMAADGYGFGKEKAQALAAATNALYKASLSGNYDLDNIYDSVKEILQQSGLMDGSVSIDIGTTTLYLTGNVITQIDWNSDKVKKSLDSNYGGHGKKAQEKAKQAMEKWSKTPLKVDGKDLQFILETNPDVVTKLDDQGNKYYLVDGKKYESEEEAKKALILKQAGVKNWNIDLDENEEIAGGTITGQSNEKIVVKLVGDKPQYEFYPDGEDGDCFVGDSPEDAFKQWLQKTDADFRDLEDEDARNEYVQSKMVEHKFKTGPKGIKFKGKRKGEGPNVQQTQDITNLLTNLTDDAGNAIETWEQLFKYSKQHPELGLDISPNMTGDLSVQDLKDIAALYGAEYSVETKQLSVNISMAEGTPAPLQDLLNGVVPTLEAELNVSKINIGKGKDKTGEGDSIDQEDSEEKEITVDGAVTIMASPLTIDTTRVDNNNLPIPPIDVKGDVNLQPRKIEIVEGATEEGQEGSKATLKNSINAIGDVNLTATNVTIIGNTSTIPTTMPGTTKASGRVVVTPSTVKVGSYEKEADISAILTNEEYDTKQQVTALIDLLGLKIKAGENSEGSETATTPVEGLPDEVTTDKGVKFGVTSDGITISGTADDAAAAAFINSQLQTFAATLIGSDVVADTNGSVKLLVGLSQIFTDSTLDLNNLILPSKLQAQLDSKLYTPEQSLMIKVLISSITSSMESGGSVKDVDEKGKVSFHKSPFTLPPIIQSILDAGQYTPDEQIQLLLAIKSASAAAENAGMKPDITGIAGLTKGEGGLSFEDMMTLVLKISDIDPQREGDIPDYSKVAGVENKTITVNQVTIVVPYKVKLNPEGSLPTVDSFDLDSSLSNVRGYENGTFNMETYLNQGNSRQEQLGNLGKYLAEIGEYKKQGGIFSEDTKGNFDALNTYFKGLGDNIPEELQGIATALQAVNSIEPGNIEETGSSITDLVESPALQDDTTANNLTSLSEGIIKCCQIDVGHLQQFYHILKDLPDAANTFVGNADWDRVVEIFRLLEDLNGGGNTNPEGEGSGGEPEVPTGPKVLPIKVEIILDELGEAIFGSASTTVNVKTNTETETPEPPTPAPAEQRAEEQAPQAPQQEVKIEGSNEIIQEADAISGAAEVAGKAMADAGDGMNNLANNTGNFNSNVKDTADNISKTGTQSTGAVKKLEALTTAINNIPSKATIDISADVGLTVHVSSTKATGTNATGSDEEPGPDVSIQFSEVELNQHHFNLTKAKGTNLALPTGTTNTLMGELGPELVVTNGHYIVVGQGGAEFVDLPNDAIVFNHEKTAQLLKHGKTSRGKPLTNTRNAISFAKGNIMGGPAMASASAALAALKQLRAMWASMLNASAKDLGSQAGRGGGGGKDEEDKYVQPTTTTADIQRWYNWLRQIDKIEQDITYQEKLQKKYDTDRIANGDKIYQTQKERLKLLDQEISRNQRLADLQKSWYDRKREELANSSYGKIFTYDENGLQQYVGTGAPGSGLGLDILENLTRRTVEGEAIGNAATSKKQLQYLTSVGFDINDLIYNDDGTKVVNSINKRTMKLNRIEGDDTEDEELYTKLMENFWARVDGWRDELDSLYDSYQDQLAKIEENQAKQNEIIQGFVKNELSVEEKLLKAVESREQAVIDKLQEQRDALEKSTTRFIKGVQDALDKQKEIQEKNDQQEELTKLQRQLAILQRSGGSASQIKSLQDQITSKQQDLYYEGRQDEIDAIQDAADKQLEKLDKQIDLLTETLEYQKNNGLFWNEVREIMEKPTEFATEFYNQWVTSKSGESALKQEEDLREFKESFQQWIGYKEDRETWALEDAEKAEIAEYEDYKTANENYLNGITDENKKKAATASAEEAAAAAKSQYLAEHEGDEAGAKRAAARAYNESLQKSYISSQDKETNEQFGENYEQWLENRRITNGANDITNQAAFTDNEATFREAVQAHYLLNKDNPNKTSQEVWKESLQAGFKALNSVIDANYNPEENKEGLAGTLLDTAAEYGFKNNKWKRLTKKAFAKGQEYKFDQITTAGKKNIKYLHIKGLGDDKGWVEASYVSGGNKIYEDILASQKIAGINGIDETMVGAGANQYYDASVGNTIDLTGLNKGDLKFPSENIQVTDLSTPITRQKKNNTITISDLSGMKLNAKGKINELKTITVSAIADDQQRMHQLVKPVEIKSTANIKKKLNELISDKQKYNLMYTMNKYASGGMNYSTGPAWLDGTKERPEAVLNASQTSFLKNDLLGNQRDSLKSIVLALQDSINGSAINNTSDISNDSINIDNIEVTFESGVISNDYDMKRASELFKDELVKIARKSGNRSVTRR